MYEVNTMLDFITNYGGSIAVGAAVLAVIALIIVKFVKDKRAGRSSCGCGCTGCASCGCGCRKQLTEQTDDSGQ